MELPNVHLAHFHNPAFLNVAKLEEWDTNQVNVACEVSSAKE